MANNCNHYNQNDWVYRKKIHLQTQSVWRNRSRGGSCPLAPPLAIALEWRWLLLFPTKMTLVTHKHCLVLRKSRTRSRHRGQRSLFSPMPIKNIPPSSIAFLQTTHLDMHSLCFFLKQGLFERSFEKRVIVEKIAHRRTSEFTLPCTGTRWGGGGGVSLSLLLSL